MRQVFQTLTKRYANILGVLIGAALVRSTLLYSGCGTVTTKVPTPPPDTTAPTSAITSPANGATVTTGTPVAITGTASDTGGGTVTKVEVSVDGGATFAT